MRSLYIVSILAVSVALLWFIFRDRDTHTRMFCAYGKVFVEFEEVGNIWGTIMLDSYGRPFPCKEDDIIEYTPSKSPVNFI